MLAGNAAAQQQTAQSSQEAQVEEIIVTGTRVLRDGFEAPTPLTVMGVEELEAAVPENIAVGGWKYNSSRVPDEYQQRCGRYQYARSERHR